MSKQERQSMFKIVSLTKHQPIFLYKQLEHSTNTQVLRQKAQSTAISQRTKIQKSKPDLSQLQISANGLNPLLKSYLQRRMESSSFNEKGRTKPHSINSQDREKTQRIIKEYLKIAYKKTETDRRAQAYRLPIIGCLSVGRSQKKKDDKSENNVDANNQGKAISYLKFSKRHNLHCHQHFQKHITFQKLSGWDHHPNMEDF